MTNELTGAQWAQAAKELQAALTDQVIENAVRQLPPEMFSISGNDWISKLKSRRGHLEEWAAAYYRYLMKEADIPGTAGNDLFEVNRINDHETEVSVYNLLPQGEAGERRYHRIFLREETEEIRLFGLAGNDRYAVRGNVNKGIHVRMIGGDDKDVYIDSSTLKREKAKTEIYDDANNDYQTDHLARLHLNADSLDRVYLYDAYRINVSGVRPSIFYSYVDKIYVRVGYMARLYKWKKFPYRFQQGIYGSYSISQNAFSVTYKGDFIGIIGKWNLTIDANYDAARWTNYYGLGNETIADASNNIFYRMSTKEWQSGLGLNRRFGKYHFVNISGFVQKIKIVPESNKYVADYETLINPAVYARHHFSGARIDYSFQHLDDPIIPIKGVTFNANATYTNNWEEPAKSFADFGSSLYLYLPLFWKFSLAIRTGAETISGTPEFFQYPSIGGSQIMRGFRRDRFRGQTAFYNSNEVRWLTNFRSYLFNGKAGFVALLDDGRVWMPGEQSDVWHHGYGGGIIVAPYNKILASITYGISNEVRLFHIRITKPL